MTKKKVVSFDKAVGVAVEAVASFTTASSDKARVAAQKIDIVAEADAT